MKLVVIESPYAGDIDRNLRYAKAAVKDCLSRGEAPYASHLFFTLEGILNDTIPEERKLGIQAGFEWGQKSNVVAVYADLGISKGMQKGIDFAKSQGRPVETRYLGGNWENLVNDPIHDLSLVNDQLRAIKERFVGEQMFGEAAKVRDIQDEIKKLKHRIKMEKEQGS